MWPFSQRFRGRTSTMSVLGSSGQAVNERNIASASSVLTAPSFAAIAAQSRLEDLCDQVQSDATVRQTIGSALSSAAAVPAGAASSAQISRPKLDCFVLQSRTAPDTMLAGKVAAITGAASGE